MKKCKLWIGVSVIAIAILVINLIPRGKEVKFFKYDKVRVSKGFYLNCIGKVLDYDAKKDIYFVWTSCWEDESFGSEVRSFRPEELLILPEHTYKYLIKEN